MTDTATLSHAEAADLRDRLTKAEARAARLEEERRVAEERTRAATGTKEFVPPGPFGGFGATASAALAEVKAKFEWPSWSRVIITTVVVAAAGVGIYMCAGVLAGAALALGAPAFVQWALAFLAYAFAAYFGGKMLVGLAKYFLSQKVDQDFARGRDGIWHAVMPSQKQPTAVYVVPQAA